MAGDGLFRIPGMINPAGLDISFYGFLLCAAIAFVASGAIAFLVTDPTRVPRPDGFPRFENMVY